MANKRMAKLESDGSGAWFALVTMLLALFYSVYRYPFQISSSATSPGYSDTPLGLQAGKYVLFSLFALWRAIDLARLGCGQLSMLRSSIPFVLGAAYLAVHPFIASLGDPDPGRLVSALFWIAVPLLIITPADASGVPRTLRLNRVMLLLSSFFYASAAFFVVEVILFASFQRLPALSYDNSIIVRFGGIWDDPNGDCVFLSFFLPFVAYSKRSLGRKIFECCVLAAQLVGTQSLTGMMAALAAFFFTTLMLLFFDGNRAIYRRAVLRPVALLGGVLALAFALDATRGMFIDGASAYFDLKSGSIEGHAKSLDILASANWLQLVGLESANLWGESSYANWIANYGLAYVFVFIMTMFVLLARTVTMVRRHRLSGYRIFLSCILCFQLTYMIALVNLPLDAVFPVNLLFIALSAMTFRDLSALPSVLRVPV